MSKSTLNFYFHICFNKINLNLLKLNNKFFNYKFINLTFGRGSWIDGLWLRKTRRGAGRSLLGCFGVPERAFLGLVLGSWRGLRLYK